MLRPATAKSSGSFRGFPREAFSFLSDLSRNNNKAWFDAHRGIYDAAVIGPALAFVESLGAALKTVAASVKAEPRIGGSLFRIHRDTRFSADRSPYKTHVGIRLRDGDTAKSSKCAGPLFYVEFDAKSLRLGVGVKDFDNRTLEVYRRAVAGKKGAKEFGDIIRLAQAKGHDVLGDTLTRVPPPFADQVHNELLKRKGLFVREESNLPAEIHQPAFIGYCRRWFEPYAPLFHELRRLAISGLE